MRGLPGINFYPRSHTPYQLIKKFDNTKRLSTFPKTGIVLTACGNKAINRRKNLDSALCRFYNNIYNRFIHKTMHKDCHPGLVPGSGAK